MNNEENKPRRFGGSLLVYAFIGLGLLFLFFLLPQPGATGPQDKAISDLAADVKAGKVQEITIRGDQLAVKNTDGTIVSSHKEPNGSLTDSLRNYGVTEDQLSKVTVRVEQPADWSWLLSLLWLLPLVMLGVFFFQFRRGPMGGSDNQPFNFARSRARQVTVDRPQVKFTDVAGVDEAKQELVEIVDFLKFPAKFTAVGARIPKGVLLVGPPGTGKTLLARAVAGEAGVPFFSISGSEFVELFVGVGASRVRDLFDRAKKAAPCIIFIDEIDAVGRQRGAGLGGGHDEREQTLNQILTEMDGFEKNANVVVIAATNRPDVLDPALLRPGRFDRRVVLEVPDLVGRLAILNIHARGKSLDGSVDLARVARLTPGFSGADLENLMNEAALLTARRDKQLIGESELEEAIDRVIVGPERKSRRITEDEKRITAFHEAGHALVAHMLPNADPVHKISIVARGMSGGHTRLLPEEDRYLWKRSQLYDWLAYSLGGMAAEQMVLGETTTGPGNDLEQATKQARAMVSRYGMSDVVGPVVFGNTVEPFLGRELAEGRNYSEQTAGAIDNEVRRLVEDARDRARQILDQYRDKLDYLARMLIEKETLRANEVEEILGPPAHRRRLDVIDPQAA